MENAKWALDTRIATEQELTFQMIRLIAVDAVTSVVSARFVKVENAKMEQEIRIVTEHELTYLQIVLIVGNAIKAATVPVVVEYVSSTNI